MPKYAALEKSYSRWENLLKRIIETIGETEQAVSLLNPRIEEAGQLVDRSKVDEGVLKLLMTRDIIGYEKFERPSQYLEKCWQIAVGIFDDLAKQYDEMIKDPAFPELLLMRKSMESEGAVMENREQTTERIGRIVHSVKEIVKMFVDVGWRGIVFDCPQELQRVIDELKKELGWESRIIYKKKVFTISVLVNASIRKMKEEGLH